MNNHDAFSRNYATQSVLKRYLIERRSALFHNWMDHVGVVQPAADALT